MRKTIILAACTLIAAPSIQAQMPCPIRFISGQSDQNTIRLDFRNNGKVPIQQLNLSCTPAPGHVSGRAVCHTENGLFYPGMTYTVEITYPEAARHAVTLSLKSARISDGSLWTSSSSEPCRTLRVSGRKNS